MKLIYSAILLLLFLLSPMGAPPLGASDIAELQIVRISPRDRAAVVKSPENKLSVIREGSRIEGVGTVVEIGEKRVVIAGSWRRMRVETLIIRLEGGMQRTERIRKAGGRQSVLYAPKGVRTDRRG